MTPTVPTRLMSADRAAVVARGARRAAEVIAGSFPPRPEDADGALAVTEIEVVTNQVLATELPAVDGELPQRQWWLEGLVLGYCASAVRALQQTSEWWDMTPEEHLADMEASVVPRLPEENADATAVVFALCRALLDDDDVALMWALENTWRPAHGCSRDLVRDRVRSVLLSALGTCCASWKLLLAAEASDPGIY